MNPEQSHYVALWYQKRFLPLGQSNLYYLDLKPETVVNGPVSYNVHGDGRSESGALDRTGPPESRSQAVKDVLVWYP
jgi:hypothetical protein